MPLQSQVNLSVAPGVAGDKATPDQSIYTPLNPLAAVALPVGRFVFPVVDSGAIDNTRATNVAGTATAVLGFVERVINYVNYEIFSDGTLTVPEGSNLTVAVKGDYWAVSTTKATVGQAVLASTADGSISTGTPDGTHLDTGWVVKTPGEIGEPIIISNWGQAAASGSGGDLEPDAERFQQRHRSARRGQRRNWRNHCGTGPHQPRRSRRRSVGGTT